MNQGYIALHRRILDNPILSKSRTYSRFEAFIYMLLRANHKQNKVVIGNQMVIVKRGSFVTSQKKLQIVFNWGSSKLKAFLLLLENDKMIDIKTNNLATMITIIKYDTYQDNQKSNRKQSEIKQKTTGKQSETNNNDLIMNNNENKEQSFINKVLAEGLKITPMVAPNIIDDFCNYWTERNIAGKKMKFEMQQTFDIKRRLSKWLKNQKDWNVNTKKPPVNYKTTTTGHFIGYCEKCNESSFYNQYNLKGDSVCCSALILPERKE